MWSSLRAALSGIWHECERCLQVRATGGGAFKYAELFWERLGVVLCKEDEMACLVDGCSFLLKAIRREAFEFQGGEYAFKSASTGPHCATYLHMHMHAL